MSTHEGELRVIEVGDENIMELRMILVDNIKPNPFQPREGFERDSLKELADSMKNASLIQPIVVRQQHGGQYQIIAGERRWRAAQIAGLKEIPCIIRDIAEDRVLLESLSENLHRIDLTDSETENAIHELWERRSELGFTTKAELANAVGISDLKVSENLDAWEFRRREEIPKDVSTRVIRGTRGLPDEQRRQIIGKVAAGELKASEVDNVSKIVRKSSDLMRKDLLKSGSHLSVKMAETIVTKLPETQEQEMILNEIRRLRLTEDEVQERVREIQHAKEMAQPMSKDMVVKEGIVYTVGEYQCSHCGRHYLIKCDGKRDWVE